MTVGRLCDPSPGTMGEPSMQIRDMTGCDLEAVVAVIALSDDDDAEAARTYFEDRYAGLEEGNAEACDRDFVSVDGSDSIIGVGGVQKDDEEGDGIWWLNWWYVHPSHQNQGIGNALMEESLRWVRDQKGRKVYVDVSALDSYEKARRFYAKHGFVEEARLKDFYAEGEDMILMGKLIAQPLSGPGRQE
jgi:ribosomal protein S18 acetylase RimI-like enzyme